MLNIYQEDTDGLHASPATLQPGQRFSMNGAEYAVKGVQTNYRKASIKVHTVEGPIFNFTWQQHVRVVEDDGEKG